MVGGLIDEIQNRLHRRNERAAHRAQKENCGCLPCRVRLMRADTPSSRFLPDKQPRDLVRCGAVFLRERLAQRWLATERTVICAESKRVSCPRCGSERARETQSLLSNNFDFAQQSHQQQQQQEEERTTSNGRRKQCGVVYAVDCRERLVAFGHTVDCDPGSDQSDCATSYISITATIIVISHHRPLHIDPIRLGSSCAEWHSFVFCFSLSSLCAQLSALTHSLTHLFS